MSEWESRLYRRIEELVASSDDDDYSDGSSVDIANLQRLLTDTRDEVSAVRADLAGLRDAVTFLVGSATDESETAIAALRTDVESLTSEVRRRGEDTAAAAG